MLARILVVMVALSLGTLIVWRGTRGLRLVSHEQREKDRIVAEYSSLRKQNDDLRRQLRYLRTPQGVAHQARKQGFVKPGEISLVIPEPLPNHKANH